TTAAADGGEEDPDDDQADGGPDLGALDHPAQNRDSPCARPGGRHGHRPSPVRRRRAGATGPACLPAVRSGGGQYIPLSTSWMIWSTLSLSMKNPPLSTTPRGPPGRTPYLM